jgi:hypothetical protein
MPSDRSEQLWVEIITVLLLVSGIRLLSSDYYTRKNAQIITSLQTSCYKSVHKMSKRCLFPVVVTSLEQAVNNL